MPTDYSNDPFDFSVGTLWSADGDGNYTKLGEVSEVKTIKCVDMRDTNSMFPSVCSHYFALPAFSFSCRLSHKSKKRLVDFIQYGWKAKGPLRKRLIRKISLYYLYYFTKEMKKYVN